MACSLLESTSVQWLGCVDCRLPELGRIVVSSSWIPFRGLVRVSFSGERSEWTFC